MSPRNDLGFVAAAVGEPQAAALRAHLEEVALADGQRLLTDGVPSGFLYLLVEGELAVVYEGGDRVVELGVRGPGSWLGEVGVLDGGPATATVLARGPGRALRMHKDTLVRLATEHPEVASALLRHLTRQLAERISASSSGILERLAPGQVRVHKPEEVRSWAATLLGWLSGGAR